MTSAHAAAEAEQLGNLLGSTPHYIHPLHRKAIMARAQQLKDLVRNVPSVSEHLDKGLKVQEGHQMAGELQLLNDDLGRRLIREAMGSRGPPMRHSVGAERHVLSDASDTASGFETRKSSKSSRASAK